MQYLKPHRMFRIKFLLTLILIITLSCGTTNPFRQSQEELDAKIKTFNFEFESKVLDRSSRFIHPDFLDEFQKKSIDFTNRVTIYEVTTLDLKIFLDDKPVITTSSLFEKDFNKAELTQRYQLSVLPSTKLKTIVVKQEWVKFKNVWFVIPNLDLFLD